MKGSTLFFRPKTRAVLALLVGAALLACHGVFGGFHLFPSEPALASSGAVSPGASHPGHHPAPADAQAGAQEGGGQGGGGTAHAGAEYAAVLLAVAVGAALRRLLGVPRRLIVETLRPAGDACSVAWVPALARGPGARALLQVFRL